MKLQIWANQVRGRGLLLANALGVQPPSVSDWITGKKQVPLEQCVPIERATNGCVTCEEMRPDKAADFAYLRGIAVPASEVAPAEAGN